MADKPRYDPREDNSGLPEMGGCAVFIALAALAFVAFLWVFH